MDRQQVLFMTFAFVGCSLLRKSLMTPLGINFPLEKKLRERRVCMRLFIWGISGAKSAAKRDLNTIVLVEWDCSRVGNY